MTIAALIGSAKFLGVLASYAAFYLGGWYMKNRTQINALVKAAEQLGLDDVLAQILAAAKARGK